ncbi:MAG: gamma-glutamylcyclotransferase [Burkholderiales bacterium]|nr:gamma-glutamylcyclotransferase [Burkholderiales bacterium]
MIMRDCKHVFTYGSLMFPVVWRGVVRGDYHSATAVLSGLRRLCVRGEEHPALVVAPQASALAGVVYFDVEPDDLARLDYFEGREYARVSLSVQAKAHEAGRPDFITADAYLALNIDDLLTCDWDVAAFERDGLPRFLARYAVDNAPRD